MILRKFSAKNFYNFFSITLTVALFVVIAVFFGRISNFGQISSKELFSILPFDLLTLGENGQVLGIEDSQLENSSDIPTDNASELQSINEQKIFSNDISQSEHYALREITFGGFEVDMSGEAKNIPLKISNIKGESMISRDNKSASLMLSWKTSKLATSQVVYMKNDGPAKATFYEQDPGLSHALVLNFEPATRYTYFITAEDNWGNAAVSEKFVAFISTKNDNIVDIIATQFKEIFSWVNGLMIN